MKISGARTPPLPDTRRRLLVAPDARPASAPPPADAAAFLGLSEADLTAPVRLALQTLLTEVDDLRAEVARLKARLAEAEGLADQDALTPLLNRRAFMRELNRIRTFAQRYGSPASLIYFDVDGLKGINDRFGHAAGDAALKAVADRLLANVRESDIVARMGGDEFAVILAQADRFTARAKAESLAAMVAETPVQFGDWSAPMRLSFGVKDISPDTDAEAIVAEADAAMYAMKRARKAG
ncbi:GGDEF domain-containing protein [Phenylobacterium terrae]|uniref:diguanylate cyclase n=1 Tax=Phenylobacterium terrae TaxID=2665495 RepID=A0ABW4N0N7_9CAUL